MKKLLMISIFVLFSQMAVSAGVCQHKELLVKLIKQLDAIQHQISDHYEHQVITSSSINLDGSLGKFSEAIKIAKYRFIQDMSKCSVKPKMPLYSEDATNV